MTEDSERRRLLEEVLDARSLQEIECVEPLAREYLDKHPDDALALAMEQLVMMRFALGRPDPGT